MSHFESYDGTRIYYEDAGRGDPLLFIHGWPLSGAMWEYQVVPLIEAGFRCITYDRRGFGRSDKPGSGYDYGTLGGDLAALIDHLDLNGVTLVGFSMGGGEVADYLSGKNMKRRVVRAMLVSSIVPYMLKTSDNPDGVDGKVFDDMQTGLRGDRPAFLTDFVEKFFGVGLLTSPVSDPMIASCCEIAMTASPIATLACVDSFGRTDLRAAARKIDVPVRIIHGDGDEIVPIAVSGKQAASLIPKADLKIYPGAPHGLHYTHRADLNADIAAFASEGRVVLQAA